LPPFRPRRDDELNGWSDDDLIAHIRAARSVGDRKQARLALQILVFGHYANITRRVSLKIPTDDVELVAGAAFDSAFTSAFDGQSVGEFHAWLNTIVARRIADYHRREQGRRVELIEDGEDDPSLEQIDARSAIDQALGELSEAHLVVIDLYVLNDAEPTAQEVADRINEHHGPDPRMTDQNVQQIASRFRKRLRELLLEGDT
jgi:RNA polymerase sigma factor (sigma-70 family)